MLLLAFVVCTASVFTSFIIADKGVEKRRIEEEEKMLREVKFYKENYPEEKWYLKKIAEYIRNNPKNAVLFIDKLGIDPNVELDVVGVDSMFAFTVQKVLSVAARGGRCDIETVTDLYKRGGNPNQRRWFSLGVYSAKEVASSTEFSHPSSAEYCANKIKKMFNKGREKLIKKDEAKKKYEEFKKKQEEEKNNMPSASQ